MEAKFERRYQLKVQELEEKFDRELELKAEELEKADHFLNSQE